MRVRGDTAVQCRIARLRIANGQPRPACTVRRRVDPRVIHNVQPVALPATTTPRSTQPCIPPGSLNRVPASAGGKGGNVTSAGWQVTLSDPIWHVSSRSGVATLRTAIHLLLTYLLTPTPSPVFCARETRLESSSTTNAYTSWQANWQMFVATRHATLHGRIQQTASYIRFKFRSQIFW